MGTRKEFSEALIRIRCFLETKELQNSLAENN